MRCNCVSPCNHIWISSECIPSGVLGKGDIVVINVTSLWVEDNVLKNGSELDGVENIWLLLGGETNSLCVALYPVS